MKRFVYTILICIVLSSILLPNGNATAASYTKINYLTFANKLEDSLWNWRGRTGFCQERNPTAGSCLGEDDINIIMHQLSDPNGDGDLSDMYFKISDPAVRINYLNTTKDNRYFMKVVVMQFERSVNPAYWIVKPDIGGSQIGMVNDNLYRTISSALAGDDLIVEKAFGVDRSGTFPFYSYYPNLRKYINPNSLYDLYYKTARLAPFKGNCQVSTDIVGNKKCDNSTDWTDGEISALFEARKTVDMALKYIGGNPDLTTKAYKLLQTIRSSEESRNSGGTTILLGESPNSFTVKVGSKQVNFSSVDIFRVFQFFSEASMAVRYQNITKNIASGATMIAKTNKGQMSGLEEVLADMVHDYTYVASSDYLFHYISQDMDYAGVTVLDPPPLRIYFVDFALSSRNFNSGSLTVHEMLHYLRGKTEATFGLTKDVGMFQEGYTDFLTRETLALNGVKGNPYVGYYSKTFFNNIVKRLSTQNHWTEAQSKNYLTTVYFHSQYNTINSKTKTNFEETLNTYFDQIESARTDMEDAENPTAKKTALTKFTTQKSMIINYIQN